MSSDLRPFVAEEIRLHPRVAYQGLLSEEGAATRVAAALPPLSRFRHDYAGAISESVGEYGGKVGLATPMEAVVGQEVELRFAPGSQPQGELHSRRCEVIRSRPLSNGRHEMAVQFDERAGLELLAGRTERTLGDRPLGHVGAVQDLEELIQFPLQRAFDQVDQEDEHDGKRQSAMTGEVCFGASMSGNEGRIVDELTDRSNYIIINVAGIPRSCLP